jgi:nucleoside-diphosphate-sugar epimerase
MSKERILITGANGFTGQHACSHFLNNGYEVIALKRNQQHTDQLSQDQVQSILCDLTDEEAIANVIKETKPDYILHAAGKNDVMESWQNPSMYLKANVMATIHLLEGVRKYKSDTRVLVVGSALEYNPTQRPNHPYGLTKTFQSLISKSWQTLFNLSIIIAKPTNLIGAGPSRGFCSLLAERIVKLEKYNIYEPLQVYHPCQVRDFLDIRDCLKAYEILLKKGDIGEVYPIGTGNFHSLKEVINQYQLLTNVPVPVEIMDQNHKLANKNGHSVYEHGLDLSKIRKLNWNPSIPFSSSLNSILSYYRQKL